jgi:repressor LexA
MAPILPKKKQQILHYLEAYIAEKGYAPTLTDIATKFKLALSTVHEHLEYLAEQGFISREEAADRNLTVVRRGEEGEDLARSPSIILPVLGLIAAGEPIEAIADRDTTMAVPQELVRRKNAYMLKVKGDSMVESCIMDGDYVVVEKTEYARDGDVVVALLDDGTATLKRFFKFKNFVRLQPANRNYKPRDVSSVVIQGKVLGLIRKY